MTPLFKKIAFAAAFVLLTLVSAAQSPAAKLTAVFNKTYRYVLVTAHRGDWRNAPENSLMGLRLSIEKGFDMVELDVKLSRDSQLVVIHDNTLDRTTNGKGNVRDFTLEELKKLRLKNGLGRITGHQIPTLEEMMKVAKGKIIINVDKGDDYLPQVFSILKSTGTVDQTIVNVANNIPLTELNTAKIPSDAYFMALMDMKRPEVITNIKSYSSNKQSVVQTLFDKDDYPSLNELPALAAKQVVWINSLWASQNGGHDDDLAVDGNDPEKSWGWLIAKKPAIIQTDRPSELLQFLKKKGLHL